MDLLAEARRRLALKPGETTLIPRGRLPYGDIEAEKASTWKRDPDMSYEARVGNYLQHIYGEHEYGGTQVLKLSAVNFEKVGMPKLPERSSASLSESIQHTLYQGCLLYTSRCV